MPLFVAEVHVMRKAGVLDPQGETVRKALLALGFTGVEDVRIDKRITLRLEAADADAAAAGVRAMCERLLANPVIEDFTFEVSPVGRL
ncbi:MAG TPA: phosphoribosylformylglycinamidine synthase subunit PurS [Bacillota bacterium]